MIQKIKDWLISKNGAQFEIRERDLKENIVCVRRFKDRKIFIFREHYMIHTLSDRNKGIIVKMEIEKFHEDCIHVDYILVTYVDDFFVTATPINNIPINNLII